LLRHFHTRDRQFPAGLTTVRATRKKPKRNLIQLAARL